MRVRARASRRLKMNFLPDVKVLCDVCGDGASNSETLSCCGGRRALATSCR